MNPKKKKKSVHCTLFSLRTVSFHFGFFPDSTNKQFSIYSPSSHVLFTRSLQCSPPPRPTLQKILHFTKSTLPLEPSPTAWERYGTNQGPSLPAGSSQYCSRKQAVHGDKLASICAARNLSCSGTGPSGLAGITATTHPQPLPESKGAIPVWLEPGSDGSGKGVKEARWEVACARTLRQVHAHRG